ncbi:MAG: tRNA pseudouridine(38-40) synthase TruA [Lachnospiraceae bacterium]|nr:tRNA pseudouridine(38-40) synthase TruA [Lachnospiraceae bacterium]
MNRPEDLTRRILICVAYDGTDYHGFARLKDDPQTIEGHLDKALTALLGTETEVTGTSRTDSGVHALCNAAVFDTVSSIPVRNFPDAMNTKLPPDIRVRRAMQVPADFHPRHTKTIKTYRYEIDNEHIADPLRSRYSMHVGYELNTERMQDAAYGLIGEHDFRSFCSVHTQASTTVREITDITVSREAARIFITVKGYGFLYNMVRIIAGTLIDAGRGRLAPDDVTDILYAVDRTKNPSPTADAKGLTLMDIDFLELEVL